MGTTGIYIVIALIFIMGLLLSFRVSLFLAKRAVCKVISTFRANDATQYIKALPLDSIGLAPRPFFSFKILRDYKPWALDTLVKAGIVRSTEQGFFYLSEDTLDANPNIQTACQTKKVKV